MKREDLEKLGLTKEQIDKVCDLHNADMQPLRNDLQKTQDDLKVAQDKLTTTEDALKKFDGDTYGGAPLLGLKGLVVKTHGNSRSIEVKNSILNAIKFSDQKMNEKIKEYISDEQNVNIE